jgi:SAM-dependent methyltransferase
MDPRRLLGMPALYSAFSQFIGGNAREIYARDYIRASYGARVLDIGCGPADILGYMPEGVIYTGFDASERYIASARERFGSRGQFFCADLASEPETSLEDFDIVLANGVLHHLDDRQAHGLFEVANSALKAGGRLVTLDGCYVEGQSVIARYLLGKDRGAFVRTESQYRSLAFEVFGNVRTSIRHDLMRIPYTHVIMECGKRASF